jgi:hypothetical protein
MHRSPDRIGGAYLYAAGDNRMEFFGPADTNPRARKVELQPAWNGHTNNWTQIP